MVLTNHNRFVLAEPRWQNCVLNRACRSNVPVWAKFKQATQPGLVTKCSVVQKIWSRQTFTIILNLRCDLDLERRNTFFFFSQDTPAYDAVLTNQVWLQIDQHFRRYSKNSHILITYALAVTLTLKIVNQFFYRMLSLMIIHQHTKFG